MRSILIACPMIMVTLAAVAQTAPSLPKLLEDKPLLAEPSPTPPTGISASGPGQNPIDKIKTEAECKIPTNATKPECIELMLKK
jgi:hypothetical protein